MFSIAKIKENFSIKKYCKTKNLYNKKKIILGLVNN